MRIEFELTADQERRYKTWFAEQNKKAAKAQLDALMAENQPIKPYIRELLDAGYPYAGCTSAGPIWILEECGIGTAIKVKHWLTKEELDLTDYDCW